MAMGRIEELILRYSARGMDVLRPYLPEDFCVQAANAIQSWPRGTVVLTTGFYVDGKAETDGPTGTLFLAQTLRKLGFSPLVVTDEICRDFFEKSGVPVCYLSVAVTPEEQKTYLETWHPVGMISVERCGENIRSQYANMRGISIGAYTAPLDQLFVQAPCQTIGIGDGGNEIGMGNLAEVIQEKLSLVPCRIPVDYLVIATVSNWGALGLCAALGKLPEEHTFLDAYALAKSLGFVDGVTKKCTQSEDGFDLQVGLELLQQLKDSDQA